MKPIMRELSALELESIHGGGFWGDLLAAIGNALDAIVEGVENIVATIRAAF